MSLHGKGKRGSARTIIAFRFGDKAFFIYAFKKNTRANITSKEERALKLLAKLYFGYSEKEINAAIQCGELLLVENKDG